jgi:kynurenine formamidase
VIRHFDPGAASSDHEPCRPLSPESDCNWHTAARQAFYTFADDGHSLSRHVPDPLGHGGLDLCTPLLADHVTVADVLAAEQDQQVRIGQGDIVLVRVGHRRRRNEQGPWDAAETRAGLHPAVLPLLAQRRIAALGSDGNNDTAPSAVAGVGFPVHVLAVNALGLHLLDYLQFTQLSQVCAEIRRWSFLCMIAPLRLPTGTGSPANPIAIL